MLKKILNHLIGLKSGSITSSLELFRELYGAKPTKSGQTVTVDTALGVAGVFAICRVIGEGVAQVPLKLMQKVGDARKPAEAHSLYDLLAYAPNRWQTSFEFRELVVWHAVLTGNHYSFINRVGPRILELYPFEPHKVAPKFERGRMTYEVTADDGTTRTFPAESIWHVRGPSWNGWQGLSFVQAAREAIGLSMVTESAVANLHRNGLRPTGVYSVEGTLKDKDYQELAKWIEQYVGADNSGKPLIMDRAAKWTAMNVSALDAQTIETRRFQLEELCRFARVNPIMVQAESKNTTYASAEQMFLSHVVHTLAPWYSRLEGSLNRSLLLESERRKGYYFTFVEEGLLRGSLKETKDTLLGYVNGGIMYPNEARAKLDLNPDPNPESNKLRIPANIVGEDPLSPEPEPDKPGNPKTPEKE